MASSIAFVEDISTLSPSHTASLNHSDRKCLSGLPTDPEFATASSAAIVPPPTGFGNGKSPSPRAYRVIKTSGGIAAMLKRPRCDGARHSDASTIPRMEVCVGPL